MRKNLNVELLDTQKLISVNNLKEISNPITFQKDNIPTQDGLLSNDIFGISTVDRGGTFAYIDLSRRFMHPLVYKIWGRMDNSIKNIVHGLKKYRIDENGYFVEDENGSTGINFLIKNIDNIKIRRTDSNKRDENIKFIEANKKNLFIKQCIVIPAYYRDVNVVDGRVGIGEVNQLYRNLIVFVKALKETADYGINLSDSVVGRIQDTLVTIYNWFVDEPNLSKKKGIKSRAVMSKTADYASRLVISSPSIDYERYDDMLVDIEHTAVPLSSLCVNFYPYFVFHLRTFFENEFSSGKYPYLSKKSGKVEYVDLKNTDIEFSDSRIKKEIDRFIRGFSNRLIPIEIPNEQKKTIYMRFKGRRVMDIHNTDAYSTSPLLNRKLTWCDLLYMAANEIVKDKHVLITRYPLLDYLGEFPTKIVVGSTKETEPMFLDNNLYRHYPKIREEDIGSNTSSMFIDTMQMSNVHLPSIGGDYDGDQVTCKGVYTIEANSEIDEHINSLKFYIGTNGINVRTSTNESVQAIYNLTKVLKDSKLTKPEF